MGTLDTWYALRHYTAALAMFLFRVAIVASVSIGIAMLACALVIELPIGTQGDAKS